MENSIAAEHHSRAKLMARIIVYVSGGVVQNVLADSEGVEVMIVDYDNEEGVDALDRSFAAVPVNKAYFDLTVSGAEN